MSTEPEAFTPIDRKMQLDLLRHMAAVYPNHMSLHPFAENYTGREKEVIATIFYLMEHGLCITEDVGEIGWEVSLTPPRITAKGLDFLADDGGLSAILSVVTIKFDASSLKAMVKGKIEDASIPEEEKSLIRKQLEDLPETALKAGMTNLVKIGLDHVPDLLGWLRICAGL